MARGDDALVGKPEDIPSHRFPPDETYNRIIWFKGVYLLIVNTDTDEQEAYEDNWQPSTEYQKYEIPVGYTCYIRGASVYFDLNSK